MYKELKTLRKGKIPGTLVVDYPKGEERQFMIDKHGGRLFAEGLKETDIDSLLSIIKSRKVE